MSVKLRKWCICSFSNCEGLEGPLNYTHTLTGCKYLHIAPLSYISNGRTHEYNHLIFTQTMIFSLQSVFLLPDPNQCLGIECRWYAAMAILPRESLAIDHFSHSGKRMFC